MKLTAALATLAALALAAQPPQAAAKPKPPSSANQCFLGRSVESFAAPNSKEVNIRVNAHDYYHFEMFGDCPEIDWKEGIALVSRGGNWICSGMDAEIVVPSSIGPQRCPVRNIRKLTPDEVKALPARAKP